MTANVTVEIDGQTYPVSDARWLQIAPCGCINGCTLVDHRPHGPVILDVEQAWKEFKDSAEALRRDKAAGFVMRLAHRSEVQKMTVECPHTPKWGVDVAPIPDGYTWAAPDMMPDSRARMHLVPGAHDREARYVLGDKAWDWRDDTATLTSLCGKKGRMWSTHWSTSGTVTCLRCEAKARAQEVAA